jgi:hypothetical protein
MIVMPAAGTNYDEMNRARAMRPLIKAGAWIASEPGDPPRIAGLDTIVAFHAGGTHVWLPYCDGETALRYLEKKRIDYVVLRTTLADRLPYLEDWALNGPPDPRARKVFAADLGEGDAVTVYRLDW